LEQVMVANLMGVRHSWRMNSDGSYTRLPSDAASFSAHHYFMTNPSLSGRGSALERHRPSMPTLITGSA
jgi:polyphosphate kinase